MSEPAGVPSNNKKPEAWIVVLLTNLALLIMAMVIPLPQISLDKDLVGNLLGSNLTLSGTLLAFVGIAIGFAKLDGRFEKRTVRILSVSLLSVMTISTVVVFLCFYWNLVPTLQTPIEALIGRMFFLLPFAMIVTGIETVVYLVRKL